MRPLYFSPTLHDRLPPLPVFNLEVRYHTSEGKSNDACAYVRCFQGWNVLICCSGLPVDNYRGLAEMNRNYGGFGFLEGLRCPAWRRQGVVEEVRTANTWHRKVVPSLGASKKIIFFDQNTVLYSPRACVSSSTTRPVNHKIKTFFFLWII